MTNICRLEIVLAEINISNILWKLQNIQKLV